MSITTAGGVADSVAGFITTAQSAANTALNTLNTWAQGWSTVSWTDITPASLVSMASLSDSDSAIATALAAFDTTLAGITPPSLPSAPVDVATAPTWSDTHWTNLKTLLEAYSASITGSDDVVSAIGKLTDPSLQMQYALFSQGLARRQQVLRDKISAANSATGARGFTFPTSMTVAAQINAQFDYEAETKELERTLTTKIFEWAKGSYEFALRTGIEAHNADVEFNIRYATVAVQTYEAQVRALLQGYRDGVAGEASKLEAKIKEYALRLDVVKTQNQSAHNTNTANVEVFRSQVQQHVSDITMSIENLKSNAELKLKAATEALNASVQMLSSASQISIGVLTQ